MPLLCCGGTSVQVDKLGSKPGDKPDDEEGEKENNNNNKESKRTDGEVADSPDYSDPTPGHSNGHSNGLVKLTSHKQRYNVNPDTGVALTSSPRDPMANINNNPKGGRKLPMKKGSPPPVLEEAEGEDVLERTGSERSTPKKKNGKKSAQREMEEMEMTPLEPGFYGSGTLQSTGRHPLYQQQTFEDEEEEEFIESVENERRKNKQRQRMKKKQHHVNNADNAAPTSPREVTQAAYERAQKEIDRVLGPRPSHSSNAVPDVLQGERKRSKRRPRKGQMNEAFQDESGAGPSQPGAAGAGQQGNESIDEVKSRVYALLDDAFSLLSNSYSSIGNKVGPTSNRVAPGDSGSHEPPSPRNGSSPTQNMPEVEEAPARPFGFAPKPGEKLHIPMVVERPYGDYDPDGLVSWSPYRVSDEAARIVLPDLQQPDVKAPSQEKLHTTTFMGTASGNSGPQYYTKDPGQPIFIRTKTPPEESPPPPEHRPRRSSYGSGTAFTNRRNSRGGANMKSQPFGGSLEESYPGLEAYEQMLDERMTTTVNVSAAQSPNSSTTKTSPDTPQQMSSRPASSHAEQTNKPDPRLVSDSRDPASSRRGSDARPEESRRPAQEQSRHGQEPSRHAQDSDQSTLDIRASRMSAALEARPPHRIGGGSSANDSKPPLNLRGSAFEDRPSLRGSGFDARSPLDSRSLTQSGIMSEHWKAAEQAEKENAPETADPVPHKPPTRNVGDRDERDIIASSLHQGSSPKELVDSIREELKSMSSKLMTATDSSQPKTDASKAEEATPGAANGDENSSALPSAKPARRANGDAKPLKKPRRAYIDS